MANLDAIKRKLAALTAITVERGATEDEAMNAATLIRGILKEHGLTLSDVQAFRAGQGTTKLTFGQYRPEEKIHEAIWASEEIGKHFDVRGAEMPTEDGKSTFTVFIGFEEDVTAALALYHLVRMAADTSYGVFLRSRETFEKIKQVGEPRVRTSYMSGFMHRINIRLRAMREEAKTTGTDLVVLKTQTIDEAIGQQGLEPETKVDAYMADSQAYQAGHAEADKVALTTQVEETKKIASTGS